MNAFKFASLAAAVAAIGLTVAAPAARAQVDVDVNLGAAPQCPYGYYDYPPYDCAPYGYYGPEWFTGGIFIGAGPWFHGHDAFRGSVNHHLDPHRGYVGELPHRGEAPHPSHPLDHMYGFNGTEMRDGRGHGAPMGEHEGGFGDGAHEGGAGHEGGGHR